MRDELESSRRVDLRVIKGKLLNVIQKIRGAKSGYKTAQKEEDMSGFRVAGDKSSHRKKERKHPKLRLAMKIALLVILLIIMAVMIVFYVKFGDDLLRWRNQAKQDVQSSTTETFRSSETSFIYSADKKVIAKLRGDKDSYYLAFDQIPQSVKDCFIVTEDRDFYEHDGVNILSTMKAAVLLVKSRLFHEKISRGGSTITQQLLRNQVIWKGNGSSVYEKITRKIQEQYLAVQLEQKLDKEQILEYYLNTINLGQNAIGVQNASMRYFNNCLLYTSPSPRDS